MNTRRHIHIKLGIALALVSGWAALQWQGSSDPFCRDAKLAVVNPKLPVSHPQNRCAMASTPTISWSSWLRGGETNFHYLDLLELLSRFERPETPNNKPNE